MRPEHLSLLRCPQTGAELEIADGLIEGGRVKSGRLVAKNGSGASAPVYPIVDFVPRFVSSENYAENFGFEWNLHARTQYDSESGHNVSEDRLDTFTAWPADMKGEVLLEAGSGSGRFTETLLRRGATVVSFDYSDAVEANRESNGNHPKLLLVQADIYAMPFPTSAFDRVLCYGVLQHTPNPEAAFKALVPMVKAGGHIATDIYLKSLSYYWLNTRYWVRPLTRGMNSERLYRWCKGYVTFMWPLVRLLRRLPYGQAIIWRLLVADPIDDMPRADDATLREWAILDTFDMLSPSFDLPQTPAVFERWHRECDLDHIDVRLGSNGVVATARRTGGQTSMEKAMARA
ncbi:MAG: SAM-dependent methyltransferase [Rhodospirillaceae bacterium]|nr:SAM-dependent methyltransferase [Rhodospirillaceae bacterium]